jgi:hypothetical protein
VRQRSRRAKTAGDLRCIVSSPQITSRNILEFEEVPPLRIPEISEFPEALSRHWCVVGSGRLTANVHPSLAPSLTLPALYAAIIGADTATRLHDTFPTLVHSFPPSLRLSHCYRDAFDSHYSGSIVDSRLLLDAEATLFRALRHPPEHLAAWQGTRTHISFEHAPLGIW